eukprot:403336060
MTWTQTLSSMCPDITYTFTYSNNTYLDNSVFTWDNTTKQLSLLTDETYQTGTFLIQVFANVYQVNLTRSFYLTITDQCLTATFQKSILQQVYTYELASSQILIKFSTWNISTTLSSICGKVNYQILNHGDNTLADSEIINLNEVSRELTIYSLDQSKVGNYQFKLVGFLQPRNLIKAKDAVNFEVQIILPKINGQQIVDCSKTGFEAQPVIPDISYMIGASKPQQINYQLYEWKSNIKNCDFTNFKAYYQSSELPIPGVFKFDQAARVFTIQIQDLVKNPIVGKLNIQVTAQVIGSSKSYEAYFNLILTKNNTITSQDQIESVKILQLKQEIFQETSETISINSVKLIKAKLEKNLQVKVSKVDMLGVIYCQFSSELYQVQDLQRIRDLKALKLIYIDNSENDNIDSNQKGIKNWTVTNIDSNVMKIQITWINPLSVSVGTFEYPYFFISKNLNQIVQEDLSISSRIPPQLSSQSVSLIETSENAATALTGVISLNFFLSLVMGVSLKNLWMLLNTLQIMVHMPLLSIPLPSNCIYLFKSVKNLADLDFIPKEYIKSYVLNLFGRDSSSEKEINDTYSDLDIFQNPLSKFAITLFNSFLRYENTNLLQNMGTVLVFIVTAFFLVLFLLLCKLVFKKIRMLLFNVFIRAFLKGYFNFVLAIFIGMENTDDNLKNILGIFAIGMIILLSPVLVYYFMNLNFHRLKEPAFKQKFGTLYMNLKTDDMKALLFTVAFMMRRIFYAGIIRFYTSSPVFQMNIQILLSFCTILYLLNFQPQIQLKFWFLELFNELSILLLSYLLIPLSMNSIDDYQIRYDMGWYAVAVIGLNIFLNWLNLVSTVFSQFYSKLRDYLKNRQATQMERARKYMTEKFEETDQEIDKDERNGPKSVINIQEKPKFAAAHQAPRKRYSQFDARSIVIEDMDQNRQSFVQSPLLTFQPSPQEKISRKYPSQLTVDTNLPNELQLSHKNQSNLTIQRYPDFKYSFHGSPYPQGEDVFEVDTKGMMDTGQNFNVNEHGNQIDEDDRRNSSVSNRSSNRSSYRNFASDLEDIENSHNQSVIQQSQHSYILDIHQEPKSAQLIQVKYKKQK